jgi:hypothetical protein
MTKFQTKITTAFATGAVLLNALAPISFASTTLTISGNGTGSDNTANVSANNTTTLIQTNNTDITNDVNVDANTGNNRASDNTGGNVDVTTGHAITDVAVSNTAGSNAATIDNCNCENDADVLISGNGSHSDSDVTLDRNNTTTLFQTNNTDVRNRVDVDANTGYNRTNDNTGGDVSVLTGRADTTVTLGTTANANFARIGGGTGSNGGGTTTAQILGNGTGSDNSIDLSSNNDVVLSQLNDAYISNRVDVDANTGHNYANDNTGGEVDITTGHAITDVLVDNMVGFNAADVDNCGCLEDLTAKIGGNGSDSDNDIVWGGDNLLAGFQTNDTTLNNNLKHLDSDTGYNRANDNTGAVNGESDPSMTTGHAGTVVTLENSGGMNTFGEDLSDVLENVDFDFDFGGLLGFLLHHSM